MSLMLFSKITYQSRSLKWQCGKELESREASMGSDWPQIGDVADIMHLGFGKEALRRSFTIFLKMEKYGLNDSLLKKNMQRGLYVAHKAYLSSGTLQKKIANLCSKRFSLKVLEMLQRTVLRTERMRACDLYL